MYTRKNLPNQPAGGSVPDPLTLNQLNVATLSGLTTINGLPYNTGVGGDVVLTTDGNGSLLVGGNAVTLSETFNSLSTTVTNLSTYTYSLAYAPLIQSGIASMLSGYDETEVTHPSAYANNNYNVQLTLANANNLSTGTLWWGIVINSSRFIINVNNTPQLSNQDFFWLTNGSS